MGRASRWVLQHLLIEMRSSDSPQRRGGRAENSLGDSALGTRHSALITGGGTGIGRGIALALGRRGYHMALVGRRVERLQEVVEVLERRGVRAVALAADLSDPDEMPSLFERVHDAIGPLDLLVNNAGVFVGGRFDGLSGEDIARGMATNLTSVMELTRLALPDLRKRRGAVVFVGSTMSVVPVPSASIYSTTKSGVRAFAESLRYEVEPEGVHVLLAYPPSTDTAMTRGMDTGSGLPRFPKRKPEVVGEQIVRALVSGRREIVFGGDRALFLLYRVVPWLVRAVFRGQRGRFERMMSGR